jgi:hypothetical protein
MNPFLVVSDPKQNEPNILMRWTNLSVFSWLYLKFVYEIFGSNLAFKSVSVTISLL